MSSSAQHVRCSRLLSRLCCRKACWLGVQRRGMTAVASAAHLHCPSTLHPRSWSVPVPKFSVLSLQSISQNVCKSRQPDHVGCWLFQVKGGPISLAEYMQVRVLALLPAPLALPAFSALAYVRCAASECSTDVRAACPSPYRTASLALREASICTTTCLVAQAISQPRLRFLSSLARCVPSPVVCGAVLMLQGAAGGPLACICVK